VYSAGQVGGALADYFRAANLRALSELARGLARAGVERAGERDAGLGAAVEAAAAYLHEANMPLVYGLSNVTCEAQREAVALAESIGGVIDSHTSL